MENIKTTIGESGISFHVYGIKRVSELPRAELTRDDVRKRTLKYTLVTATDEGYKAVKHEIVNLIKTDVSGEKCKEIVNPVGDLLECFGKKDEFIKRLKERDEKFCEKLVNIANNYINDIRSIIGEYESDLKKRPTEKRNIELKRHYARIREKYNGTLENEKAELLEIIKQSSFRNKWGHRISIDHLENIFSDGVLIGRHPLCQIPIREDPDSEVSHLQGILVLDKDKVRYDNLGFNLTTIMKHKGRDRKSLEHFVDITNRVIDLDDDMHQLAILFFGKGIPMLGNGKDDKRFISTLVESKFRKPQYYLALELCGRLP